MLEGCERIDQRELENKEDFYKYYILKPTLQNSAIWDLILEIGSFLQKSVPPKAHLSLIDDVWAPFSYA